MTSLLARNITIQTAMALNELVEELERARAKFPSTEHMMVALSEEHGELAKALLDEPWERVRAEAIQVACCALRIATESDTSLNAFRLGKGLDTLDTTKGRVEV